MVDGFRLLVKAPVVVAVTDPVALRRMIIAVYGDPATAVVDPALAIGFRLGGVGRVHMSRLSPRAAIAAPRRGS